MNRTSWMAFCWFCSVVVLSACHWKLEAQEFPAAACPPDVLQLIKQLGDGDFAVRENASNTLKQKPKAIPALRAALRSEDAEIRSRSKDILEGLRAKQVRLALEKMHSAKREGKIDLFVEFATSLRQDLGDEEGLLYDLMQRVKKQEQYQTIVVSQTIPASAFQHTGCVPFERYSSDGKMDHYWCAVANSASGEFFSDRGIISREGMLATDSDAIGNSVVLSNGNVIARGQETRIYNSIIFCDGNVETDRIQRSVVIARGHVKYKTKDNSLIIDGERAAMGKLMFFELSDIGLELTDDSALQIKFIKKDSLFAHSGLQVGDRLLSANGNKIESANAFRRIVRHFLVESSLEPKSLPVQVERVGKKLSLNLELD